MTESTKTQTRGICQVCGRDHAVVRGTMSKHGYKVSEHGWFVGVCGGQRYQPMQIDRSVADSTVASVRKDVVALRAKVAAMKAGTAHPAKVSTNKYDHAKREFVMVEWEFADNSQRRAGLETAIWTTGNRADMGESFANQLEQLADKYHGQPLRVVPVEAGPAPVRIGDRRQGARRVLVCVDVRGARVYWKDAEGYKGWTGTQAWRKMEVVA